MADSSAEERLLEAIRGVRGDGAIPSPPPKAKG